MQSSTRRIGAEAVSKLTLRMGDADNASVSFFQIAFFERWPNYDEVDLFKPLTLQFRTVVLRHSKNFQSSVPKT